MSNFAHNQSVVKEIAVLLIAKNKTLSIAESCTAGSISKNLTSISGSSNYFEGGIIAYSNQVKINQLSVSAEDINKFSAVSKKVVEQMARGVKEKFSTDYAVATSGYAGPDGEKVGQVFIAVSSSKKVVVKGFLFVGKREEIIVQTTNQALLLLLSEIKN